MCEPQHTARLRALPHCPAHEGDGIRKVKGGYFCGMCNVLLSTAARVGVHVGSAEHGSRRGALLLRRAARAGGGVLARGTVLLRAAAWHGLIGDACILCDAEFQDEDVHKTETAHILNLIQSTVLFGPGKSVYRKIDGDSYQCLTCNNVFADASFDEHFDSTNHKTALKQSEIAAEDHVSDDEPDDTTVISIDQKCNGDIKTTIDSKQNEVTEKSQKTLKVEGANLDDVYCKALGAKNYILQLDDNMGNFCIICHKALDNFESIPQHLNCKHHQIMFKLHKESVENKTESKKDTQGATQTKKDTKEATKTKKDTEKDTKTKKDTNDATKTKKDSEKEAKNNKESKHGNGKAQEIDFNHTDNRSQILESVSTFQKNEVNINFINDTAFCKKCTMNIDFDFNAINKHIDDHKKKTNKNEDKKVPFEHGVEANGENKNLFTAPVHMTQKREPPTSLEDIRALAKKHRMMYNGRELQCTMCDSVVPASVKNIEEHISGTKHKAKMTQLVVKQAPKKKITKEPLEDFIKDSTMVEEDGSKDIVINEKFCLSFFNFMFLGHTLDGLACIVCNMPLSNLGMLINHVNDPRHKKMLQECQIITSLESEFVREVKPDVYHCGFCNYVSDDWEDLEEHLKSSDHQRNKTRAEWRLQEHLTNIRVHKVRKQMELKMFLRMMMSNAFLPNMFMPNMFNRNSDSDSD